jgi:hypothetical protein
MSSGPRYIPIRNPVPVEAIVFYILSTAVTSNSNARTKYMTLSIPKLSFQVSHVLSSSHHPIMPISHRNTRPFSFAPGADDLSIRRQDSLQEREHAGEIYSNAYVTAVYNHLPPARREAQLVPVTPSPRHGLSDAAPETGVLSEQQLPSPITSYIRPEFPEVLCTRVPVPQPIVITPDCIEPVDVPQLPHACHDDPFQTQQHAVDTEFLTKFATVYRPEPSQPLAPIHSHQIARKPLPANANVPAHFLVDTIPLVQQAHDGSVRDIHQSAQHHTEKPTSFGAEPISQERFDRQVRTLHWSRVLPRLRVGSRGRGRFMRVVLGNYE